MKSILFSIFILLSVGGYAQFSPVNLGGYNNGWEIDVGGVNYSLIELWHDTSSVEMFIDSVRVDGLQDDRVKFVRPEYVLYADSDGWIHKCPVDSLFPTEPAEAPMAPQQFNTEVAADYAIKNVEFLDANNTAIDPTNGNAHYVRVEFTNGQTVTQPYIGRK